MKKKLVKISLKDLRDWVLNYEVLYDWWQCSELSLNKFVRQNKKQLVAVVSRAIGQKLTMGV